MADSSDPKHSEYPPGAPAKGDPLLGTLIAGRYRVLEVLGRGAMGTVYRAEHELMQRVVALKVLHRETRGNEELVKRFEREAIAVARIQHPNVALALDFGRLDSGSFYLVLEYVPGRTLKSLLDEGIPLSPPQAIDIAKQIGAALSAAHAQEVIHRDLKPENVILLDGHDKLKVLDFGLAKIGQDDDGTTQLTRAGAVYGTPAYMSPEQASGSAVDERADLYALGCILYEMLAGRPPFQAEQLVQLLVLHMTEPVQPLPGTVPTSLARLTAELLEKDPAHRPQNAETLLTRLGECELTLSKLGFSLDKTATPKERRTLESFAGSTVRSGPFDWNRHSIQTAWQALRRGLGRPVWLGRYRVSLGAILLGSLGGLALAGFALGTTEEKRHTTPKDEPSAAPQDEVPSTAPSSAKSATDPELEKVLRAARDGSDSALYALLLRNDDERSPTEWSALTHAYLVRKRVDDALRSIQLGLEKSPATPLDSAIIAILRNLSDDDRFADRILPFAAKYLGAAGADLLFDVWAKTSRKTTATTRAWEELDTRTAYLNASEALRIALDLRKAESCTDYLELMPRVEAHADFRSMVRLRELEKKTGCGAQKRDDCHPCLRESEALTNAVRQASQRAAPSFDLPRRYRYKVN